MAGLRRVIGTRPVNFVGAAGVIVNERDELLLLRRTGADRWGLVTGISELGEALPDTLRREALEEVGLSLGKMELLSPAGLAQVANGDEFYAYTALFRVSDWSGTPVPDGVEIAEARFFSPDDLPPLTRLGQKAKAWLA